MRASRNPGRLNRLAQSAVCPARRQLGRDLHLDWPPGGRESKIIQDFAGLLQRIPYPLAHL
jgi:hypothetical protein